MFAGICSLRAKTAKKTGISRKSRAGIRRRKTAFALIMSNRNSERVQRKACKTSCVSAKNTYSCYKKRKKEKETI